MINFPIDYYFKFLWLFGFISVAFLVLPFFCNLNNTFICEFFNKNKKNIINEKRLTK